MLRRGEQVLRHWELLLRQQVLFRGELLLQRDSLLQRGRNLLRFHLLQHRVHLLWFHLLFFSGKMLSRRRLQVQLLVARTVRILLIIAPLVFVGCYTDFEQPRGETTPGKQAAAARSTNRSQQAEKKQEKKKPEQTHRQAWEVICHAEQRAGIDPALPRQERGAQVAGWLVEHLKNKEVRYWFIHFGDTKEERDREAMFTAEARRAGFERCPLHDLLFEAKPAAPAE